MAIDPEAVADPTLFEARLEGYLDLLMSAPTMPHAPGPVIYPGLPEAERTERRARLGVVLDRSHHDGLAALADRFDLPLPPALTVIHEGVVDK